MKIGFLRKLFTLVDKTRIQLSFSLDKNPKVNMDGLSALSPARRNLTTETQPPSDEPRKHTDI